MYTVFNEKITQYTCMCFKDGTIIFHGMMLPNYKVLFTVKEILIVSFLKILYNNQFNV